MFGRCQYFFTEKPIRQYEMDHNRSLFRVIGLGTSIDHNRDSIQVTIPTVQRSRNIFSALNFTISPSRVPVGRSIWVGKGVRVIADQVAPKIAFCVPAFGVGVEFSI